MMNEVMSLPNIVRKDRKKSEDETARSKLKSGALSRRSKIQSEHIQVIK